MIPNTTKREFLALTNPVRMALYEASPAYTPNPDNVEFLDDFLDSGSTAQEFTGSNYSRQTVANAAASEDDANNQGVFNGDDVVFPSLGSSSGSPELQGAVIYIQVGGDDNTPGDDRILRIIDDSETDQFPETPNGQDFTVAWSAEILTAS